MNIYGYWHLYIRLHILPLDCMLIIVVIHPPSPSTKHSRSHNFLNIFSQLSLFSRYFLILFSLLSHSILTIFSLFSHYFLTTFSLFSHSFLTIFPLFSHHCLYFPTIIPPAFLPVCSCIIPPPLISSKSHFCPPFLDHGTGERQHQRHAEARQGA